MPASIFIRCAWSTVFCSANLRPPGRRASASLNSTVGCWVLRDQASRWGMPLHREDFGQSLAYYNCPAGFYFNLPFLGPSNLRDCAGMLLAIPCSLQYWLLSEPLAMSCDALIMGNESAAAAYTLDNYFKTQYDSYLLSRAMYNAQRKALASDYQIAPDCESNPDQSLGYLLLRPQDPEFASRGYERRLRLPGAKSRLPYSCWPSPGSAKTLIILPGLGGHRLSAGVLALAELLQARGYSVLALSSSLNPDYFRHLPEAAPPGFFWADRRQQALALGACVEDMQRHFKLPEQVCTVLGYSLGAINALYLSDLEFEEGLPGGLQCDVTWPLTTGGHALALSKIDDFCHPAKLARNSANNAAKIDAKACDSAKRLQRTKPPAAEPGGVAVPYRIEYAPQSGRNYSRRTKTK